MTSRGLFAARGGLGEMVAAVRAHRRSDGASRDGVSRKGASRKGASRKGAPGVGAPGGVLFPRSANGLLARAQVTDIQRRRMLTAMFDVAVERGAGNVTVADVVERSGVSRRTFYEVFADREECFLAALEQAVADASERVLPAYRGEGRWVERIRAGLTELLCFLDEEPVIGRVLIVESQVGGSRALELRTRVLAHITRAVEEGRNHAKAASACTPLVAEGVVGGVLSILHARLTAGHGRLSELTGPLMGMIVLPYLGVSAARRELDRPVPVVVEHAHDPALTTDPFKEAGMRLTYRTVRVLAAVAEQPDASNRTVGERAEIKDQGQISKLLGRLERIGLISNTGLGPGQGAPNAWTLTPKGQHVIRSVRTHTDRHPPRQGATER